MRLISILASCIALLCLGTASWAQPVASSGLSAPVAPVAERAAKADKVFVGTLTKKAMDGRVLPGGVAR